MPIAIDIAKHELIWRWCAALASNKDLLKIAPAVSQVHHQGLPTTPTCTRIDMATTGTIWSNEVVPTIAIEISCCNGSRIDTKRFTLWRIAAPALISVDHAGGAIVCTAVDLSETACAVTKENLVTFAGARVATFLVAKEHVHVPISIEIGNADGHTVWDALQSYWAVRNFGERPVADAKVE